MAKVLLSDYLQGITDIRSDCCRPFIGYFNVRLVTTRRTDTFDVDLVDDLNKDHAPGGGSPVTVRLKLRHNDLYLVSFKTAGNKEVNLDAIGQTNYNRMTQPEKITLSSIRTAVRTLSTWQDTTKPGASIKDGDFIGTDDNLSGSAALFTICSFVSEAARFQSVQRAMNVLLERPSAEHAVTGAYLDKIQCWSGASDAYFQYVWVQEGLKALSNPKTKVSLPPPVTNAPAKTALPEITPPAPESMLGEQLMRDIVIVKLPAVKDSGPDWQTWAAKRFKDVWT